MGYRAHFMDGGGGQHRPVMRAEQIVRPYAAPVRELGSQRPPPAWLPEGMAWAFPLLCPVTNRLFCAIARKDDLFVPLYGGVDGWAWTIPTKDNSDRFVWWQYDLEAKQWAFWPLREPHNWPGMERPRRQTLLYAESGRPQQIPV